MEILGVVPARGGSKAVPRKNIRLLGGKPLILYTLEAAGRSERITRTVVTTDDEEIASVAADQAEVPFLRPADLAQDETTDLPVFQHCLRWLQDNEGYRPDIVVHLRPTAPLRTAAHIDEAVGLLLQDPSADSVRSVTPVSEHPLKTWRIEGGRLTPFVPKDIYGIDEAYNLPRQRLPHAFVQNGALDIVRTETIEAGSMSGINILGFPMDEDDSVNIDTLLQWKIAEALIEERRAAPATSE